MTTVTPARGFRAYPTRRHDGDSFWVMTDGGFNGRAEPELRLLDVSAPEVGGPKQLQPGGQETTDYINGLLDAATARNPVRRWSLWVETVLTRTPEPDQKTTLERYLATVWAYDDAGPWIPGMSPVVASVNAQVNAFLAGHPDWPTGK